MLDTNWLVFTDMKTQDPEKKIRLMDSAEDQDARQRL